MCARFKKYCALNIKILCSQKNKVYTQIHIDPFTMELYSNKKEMNN